MGSEGNGKSILLVEDEIEVRSYLEMSLRCEGYSIESAGDGEEALVCLRNASRPISVVLLDIVMPRQNGLKTLREIRSIDPDLPVIMLSGASSPLNVVEAMRCGATDFLGKPVDYEELRKVVKLVLDARRNAPASPEIGAAAPSADVYLGNNLQMREIHELMAQIGGSEATVLIQGETGAGKEVLARQLHARSPRGVRPLLKLNCAALPSELVESELFGYERGAFTGAVQKKPGMFEQADGGTILLDEIGDMDFKLQAKLLQVLQDRTFRRLGGRDVIHVDVRVMAATHCDLESAIANRLFREDLYYRLNVINLRLPPLRECKEDILPMLQFFMKRHAPPGSSLPVLTPNLVQALTIYDWPGNARELENTARKLLIFRDTDKIAFDLRSKAARSGSVVTPAEAPPPGPPEPVGVRAPILERVTRAKQEAETEAIRTALHSTRWNRKQAADLLKIDYKALLYKMKKLGIEGKIGPQPKEYSEARQAAATP
jgi:two-component system response regulator AtoC